MSYDRVLPNPASLRYESAPVSTLPRPSDLLDHKIMNDHRPNSFVTLPHRPALPPTPGTPAGNDMTRYASDMLPNGVARTHQQFAAYQRPRASMKNGPGLSPVQQHVQPGPMISTHDLATDRSASSSGSSSPTKSVKNEGVQFCLCQPDPKIPRPRNAFILYRQHYQASVVSQNPGMANPEISKIIGEQWRQLSEDEKAKWKALAEEEKVRHAQQYPSYRYQPRRVGRDGSARNAASGISHNPSGGSACNRCGGRIMNAPSSPMTPFTPMNSQGHRGSFSGPSSRPHTITTTVMTASSSQCRDKSDRVPKPIRIDQIERPRQRKMDDDDILSPELKRRRLSQTSLKPHMHAHRDRGPESPYPVTPYSATANAHHSRGMLPLGLHSQRACAGAPGQSQHQSHPHGQAQPVLDPSLKLPPLQTAIPSTPVTPFSPAESSVEAAVMTIPFLNKIKLLAKISPPLVPSFRETPSRGPVIAVDGQDPGLVRTTVEYLQRLLQKEEKFSVRIFEGPDVQAPRSSDTGGPMGDATVDYLNTISAWHRISDDIINFVKPSVPATPEKELPKSVNPNEKDCTTPDGSASPRTIIPETASLQIHSPKSFSADADTPITTPSTTPPTLTHAPSHSPASVRTPSHSSASTSTSTSSSMPTPIALVPRYQLTTADTFACNVPIHDSYAPLDHWQWMASLWRACVGPDITVYVRECSREEVERVGAVEVRLGDGRTVVLRRAFGENGHSGSGIEEKGLRRLGFEIEDYLMQ
ncbi:Putative Hmg box transcriptional [Penicillium brasilianum]|uniref:Putative Hmg box transcriptional n=1 Tax=Penicillium brasilianum TaxID=104259 RepID=A0A0F7U0D6_PENBI|nr:Putative Hmg box transcriptional [Penicillium brasilianum]